jgi:hypothetical protein
MEKTTQKCIYIFRHGSHIEYKYDVKIGRGRGRGEGG